MTVWLAGDRAAAQRYKADVAALARAGDGPRAPLRSDCWARSTPRPSAAACAEQRSAVPEGVVDLHAMVHFDGFDIEVFIERFARRGAYEAPWRAD